MTTYNIYFQNDYGETQTYAFFTELPKVSSNVGNPKVFTNVWISKKVSGNGGNVSIKTTSNFDAWCGTAPKSIAPGVVVSQGNSLLATLGTNDAPGSTFTIFNDEGAPAFKDGEDFTSSPGCYEIDTDSDFLPAQNFLIGLGSIDSAGRKVPAASFAAPRNAKVNIAPVVKFYVAAYNAVQGTTIDYQSVSKNAGIIDFSSGAGRGNFGAIVVQDEYGAFTTNYVSQAQYSDAVSAAQINSRSGEVYSGIIPRILKDLQQQIMDIRGFLDMPRPLFNFCGTLTWFGGPPNWPPVFANMQAGLLALGYVINNFNSPDANTLKIWFSSNGNIGTANTDWDNIYSTLPQIGNVANKHVVPSKLALAGQKAKALEYLKEQGLGGQNGFVNSIET